MLRALFGSRGSPAPEQSKDTYSLQSFVDRYSVPTLITLIITGFAAFIITGYLGYRNQGWVYDVFVFRAPDFMFLWLCGIVLVILWFHPALSGRAQAPVIVCVSALVLISLYYIDHTVNGGRVLSQLREWLQQLGISAGNGRLVSNAINFALLGGYIASMLIRWWLRYGPHAAPAAKDEARSKATDTVEGWRHWINPAPTVSGELLSTDLISGATLASFLALVFSAQVFGRIYTLVPSGTATSCSTALATSRCPGPSTVFLSDVDIRVAVLFAVVGGIILASGSAIEAFKLVQLNRIIIQFIQTLMDVLLRLLAIRIFVLLRDVLWPICILVSAIGVGFASVYMECDLHQAGSTLPLPRDCNLTHPSTLNAPLAVVAVTLLVLTLMAFLYLVRRLGVDAAQEFNGVLGLILIILALVEALDFAPTHALGITPSDQFLLYAIAWLLVTMLALIFGVALYVVRRDVLGSTLTFLTFSGLIVLDVTWVFSFALTGIDNYFLSGIAWRPFHLISDAAWFSLGSFLVTGILFLVYRLFQRTDSSARPAAPLSKPGPVDS